MMILANAAAAAARLSVSICPVLNLMDSAAANSVAAVEAGARLVQGTLNGYGERCGNANLVAIIPSLELKLGYACIGPERLGRLSQISMGLVVVSTVVTSWASLSTRAVMPGRGQRAGAPPAQGPRGAIWAPPGMTG